MYATREVKKALVYIDPSAEEGVMFFMLSFSLTVQRCIVSM